MLYSARSLYYFRARDIRADDSGRQACEKNKQALAPPNFTGFPLGAYRQICNSSPHLNFMMTGDPTAHSVALAFVGLGPAGGSDIDRFQVGAFDYLFGPSLLADFIEKS